MGIPTRILLRGIRSFEVQTWVHALITYDSQPQTIALANQNEGSFIRWPSCRLQPFWLPTQRSTARSLQQHLASAVSQCPPLPAQGAAPSSPPPHSRHQPPWLRQNHRPHHLHRLVLLPASVPLPAHSARLLALQALQSLEPSQLAGLQEPHLLQPAWPQACAPRLPAPPLLPVDPIPEYEPLPLPSHELQRCEQRGSQCCPVSCNHPLARKPRGPGSTCWQLA
mmetsp:Transcript_497/g.1292  ORF Transcript_497/g.1292 Transcript_497/m.1292 type:complete len:224 (+) Transcript_497:112-783(+)